MGVCKCKQRNVTNQFCYVCRMNVCESCMVKDHQRCIIKSYVHWLQDSDFSATCSLCLESIEHGELVRLTCYDLFHWDCFNAWALKLPESTRKAEYTCPDCKSQIFPPQALVSPIADVLRQKFSTVGWGRKGLGLPLQSHEQAPNVNTTNFPSTPVGEYHVSSTPKTSYKPLASVTPFVPLSKQQQQNIKQQQQQQQSHSAMETPKLQQSAFSREKKQTEGTTSRKQINTTRYDDSKINLSFDHDENKYKRKGFFHWMGNMMKLWKKPSETKKEANLTFKRVFIGLVIFTLIFMTVVYLMSVIGGRVAENDPMLDPDLNRLIRVRDKADRFAADVTAR